MVDNIRPITLDDFKGQEHVKKPLKLEIDYALKTGEAFPHTLFAGASGGGKSTAAGILAYELGRPMVQLYAPSITSAAQLAGPLTKVEDGGIVFIDEIHRLSKLTQEGLYTAMEDFVMDIILKTGTAKVRLKKFTLVGATTRLGMLEVPLQDRFKLVYDLKPADDDTMRDIVVFYLKKFRMIPRGRAIDLIVTLCRGTPRLAQKHVQNVFKLNVIRSGTHYLDEQIVHEYYDINGLDINGLNEKDRLYLETLGQHESLSLSAMKNILKSERDAITEVIEPQLIKLGLIEITSKGRKLTEAGRTYIT